MSENVTIAVIALIGTLTSGILSAVISNRLVNYRLAQLEKKVDKHNNLIDRMYKVEKEIAVIHEEIED